MAPDITVRIDNRYEVLGELGRGGMGVVYKANDLKMDRLVAIKVMTTHAPGRDEYQERFLREAKSIAKMQHPNIVVVHDYGYHAGAPYMAMEYVEGVPLDKVIASRVSLTPLAKVDYIVQVCQALHYAHQQGIVHRDVKPGNIMVLEGGKRVKLLDFGIARAGGASNLSKSGLAMGTTCYMSPEQTKGQKDLDGRADIFSAGVVLYELLTGKPPWTGDSDYEIMTKIIHDPFPPPSGLSNYPPALDHIFECALAKEAGTRYQTAEKMAQELSELEAPLKEQALEEALIQFENGDLFRASDLVSQILRIDTRHREAIELQGKLQQVAQLQQRSEQVRQLRTSAEQAVGQKRYSDALASVEQAISIDSASTELFHYRELIRHEVKRRDDIRKKLELAKRAQEINDLSTAQELVDKALEADPTDTHARVMKSSLEQERKRQQQNEIADDASRALAVRAFARAREFIQQLEALDPAFAPLSSLKKALVEGETEEKRRVEIENLIREIRRVQESGDVAQSLSATEQALARFPGEPRLVRLRTQAEALRDAAERERAIQEQMARVKKLTETGQNAEALAIAESALSRLGTDYRLQTVLAQLRQTVERERQVQAEQAALAQARSAMQAGDFDSAVKVLNAARVDFPNSKDIADVLQAAQTARTQKADAVERENRVQAEQAVLAQARNAMQASDFEAALKILTAAQIDYPNSQKVADALQAVQAASAQKAGAIQRERELQAQQAALTQARRAMKGADFESALKILTAARIDFPHSKEIADALQSAQAANARKAEENAAIARKREIAEVLERALASESDPDLQVRLAEEAVRRIPENEAAERVLERVRERQRQIASGVDRAWKFEQAQRYAESIQEWERVRQLWPQHPQIAAQIARLNAALKAPPRTPERAAAPPSRAPGFSATSIMAAAPGRAPSPRVQAAPAPVERPPQLVEQPKAVRGTAAPGPSESLSPTETEAEAERTGPDHSHPRLRIIDLAQSLLRSKKLLLGIAGAVVVVIIATLLYIALRPKPVSKLASERESHSTPAPTPGPVIVRPEMGTITIRADVDQAEVWVDGHLQTVTEGQKATVTVASGSHTVVVQKTGYTVTPATPQSVKVAKDLESALQFRLKKSGDSTEPALDTYLTIKAVSGAKVWIDKKNVGEVSADNSVMIKTTPGPHRVELSLDGFSPNPWSTTITAKAGERTPVNADLKATPKPLPVIAFSSNVSTVQQGGAIQLDWNVQNATQATIDEGIGSVDLKGSKSVTPTAPTTYTLTAKGDGGTQIKSVSIGVTALPKPVIAMFVPGANKIQVGQSINLIWQTQGGTQASINPEVGDVPTNGQHEVKPSKNTTYTLTVTGPGGTETRQTEVIVESALTPIPIPAATPVPPPPPQVEDPEIKAVKDTIQVRYKNALQLKSLGELRKVYPNLSKGEEDGLKSVFGATNALVVEFACEALKVTGDSAECSCVETMTTNMDNRVGKPKTSRVTFRLSKNGGAWHIISSRAK